tara:strand:- start:529 stop:1602 length:1074 start_codon:yes stop_codon:yes gene_type:complete
MGYSVTVTDNGAKAIGMAKSQNFDLILANINLNDMDGKTFLGHLKGDEELKEIPVIIISPFSEKKELEIAKCIKAGADDFLSADLVETLIVSRIKSSLERKLLLEKEKEYLKRIEEEKKVIEIKNKELLELNNVKNKFLGIAAHDLRNPLASIIGFSEFFLDKEFGPMSNDQIEYMTTIQTVAEGMQTLVNDLLDASAIESGKLDLQLTEESLKDLISERVKVQRMVAQKKNINIQLELIDISKVKFDINRISQVIDNLISNAVKFSPPGSNVHISLNKNKDDATLIVSDEGPGISKEDQGKMFGDFQKLSAQPTAGEKSTGLGLSIVKKIVEAHKGKIFVESEIGKGSSFICSLPV